MSAGDTNNNQALLEELRDEFKECADAEIEQRSQMKEDYEFARLSKQWPADIEQQRKDDNRPVLTINRLPAFIRQVVNDARQNRPQIKVKPVDQKADRKTADVFAGLIRNIEVESKSDIAYDTAVDFAVSTGIGYFRIDVEYLPGYTFDRKLVINRVADPLAVYGDYASREADSSDWNRAFVCDWMPKRDFKKEFKNAEDVDWDASGYTTQPDWIDGDVIRMAEAWRREKIKTKIYMLSNGQIIDEESLKLAQTILQASGVTVQQSRPYEQYKITQYLMTGAEILEQISWVGKYIPIVPVYGEELNFEGERRFNSLITFAKDSQRMFNYWRTTATELVALAPRVPWVGEEGVFDVSPEMKRKWLNSHKGNYSFLEFKKGRTAPERKSLDGGSAAGAMSEALAANDDIKSVIGMYDASLGQRSNEVSGRAIMARQREGDVSTFHFIDNLARSIRHAGNVLVDLIPHVYSGARVIRIINAENKEFPVQLGKPPAPAPGMGGQLPGPAAQPGMTTPPGVPGQSAVPATPTNPYEGIYDLNAGCYDVVVDTGPSVTTRREELSIQMTEMAKVWPQIIPLIGDLMVKALDWPNADEIATRMDAMKAAQSQNSEKDKEIEKLKQQLLIMQAQLQIKAKGLQTDEFKAETDRIDTMSQIAERKGSLQLEAVSVIRDLLSPQGDDYAIRQ